VTSEEVPNHEEAVMLYLKIIPRHSAGGDR
jgi:hypothetical protein